MPSAPPIEDVLRHVAVWAGRAVSHRPIVGGLSHRIWRVDAGNRSYTLRVLDPAVPAMGLGIPSRQEIANTRRAAGSGVGARVFEALPQVPALVLEYLPGRTLGAADVHEPSTMDRIVSACRTLHSGPLFGNGFDVGTVLHALVAVCRRYELPTPDGFAERVSVVGDVRDALAAVPMKVVPCHNDLVPANLLDVGGQIHFIDFQLSGDNDPTAELGGIAAGADLDPDSVDRLAAAYFGDEPVPALAARVRLYATLSNVAWALRSCVHRGFFPDAAGSNHPDTWERARRALDSPGLGRLLDTAAHR